jgi:tripeptidyl-peptidase-1
MSQKVIDEIISPRDESGNMVMAWLERAGLGGNATYTTRGDSIIVEASIAKVEELLDAEYNTYRNTATNEVVVRTLKFSLPSALKSHLDMVQPTTFFGFRPYKSNISGLRPLKHATANTHIQSMNAVKGCSHNINPTCLANLYSFKSAKNYTIGLLGIAGFLEEYAAPSDLETFLSKHRVRGSDELKSFACVEVNNGSCPTGATQAGSEASLDVQYARGIAGSVPITYYSTAGRGEWTGDPDQRNTNEPFLEFLEYLLGLDCDDLPNTLSISYGDFQQTVPDKYATHVCDLFSQLGARGVSVLVASGDSGVGGPGDCSTDGEVKQFATTFPASCPVSSAQRCFKSSPWRRTCHIWGLLS